MDHKLRKLIVLGITLLYEGISAQVVVVRFSESVEIHLSKGSTDSFRSSAANIQQIIDHYPSLTIARLIHSPAMKVPQTLQQVYFWRFHSQNDARKAISELAGQPNVVYAEPNQVYRVDQDSEDPLISRQWYLKTVHALQAWEVETGSPAMVVGVIDTGIDYRHEDLLGQLWVNRVEDLNHNGILDSADLNGVDDDSNGYVDDVIGWDFTDAPNFPDQGDFSGPDNDPMDDFFTGHGTPVAGIIAAARNNNRGISGIAPGVRVMPLRAGTASGFLEEDDVAEAILYAIDNGCKIINMSFGDVAFSYLLRDVIQYGVKRGVLFVAAAGNQGRAQFNYPASYDETISVGATNSADGLAGFSNYGTKLNLTAPGQEILSTQVDNRYGVANGTSFSAPVVSAALALIWSAFPEYTPEQVRGALYAGCRDEGALGWDPFYGHGILNIEQSLAVSEQGFAEILRPATGSGVAEEQIAVIGSAYGPNLASYSLSFGFAEIPFEFTVIAEVFHQQCLNDTLAVWNVAGLPDSTYTLELRLKQSGLNDVVVRNSFTIDHSPPRLVNIDTMQLFVEDENSYLLRLQTDDLTFATLGLRQKNQAGFPVVQTSPYFQQEHHFVITQADISGEVEFFVRLENAAGLSTIEDNAGQYYQIRLDRELPDENLLLEKDWHPFRGFFMYRTVDFNQNQLPEILISQAVEEKQFGPLQVLEYVDGRFELKMQSEFPVIPRDVGKLRPEGGMEVLGGFGSASFILGGNPAGEYPRQLVWADTLNFWGSRLSDLLGDSQPEILALSSGKWRIFEVQGDYRVSPLQTLANPTGGSNQYGVPWALVEDLDQDGRREIIVLDLDGDLVIHEESLAGVYQPVWSARLPGKGGNSLLQAADVTGDGKKDLIAAVQNEPEILLESNVDTKFWVLTVWEAHGDNTYEQRWRKNIHGVTVQSGIHNGLSVGDIDRDGISEIIFTPFPDAYIFQADEDALNLLYYRKEVNSNAAIIEDFDRNGLPEILLNTDEGVLHLEMRQNTTHPSAPLKLQAVPLDTNKVRLAWQPASGAEYYKIYRRVDETDYLLLDSTTATGYMDSLVIKETDYQYAITQINSQFPEPESPLSKPVEVRPNAPPLLLGLEISPPRQLLLTFNEPMADNAFRVENYLLLSTRQHPASAARHQNRRTVILSFLDDFQPRGNRLRIRGVSDFQGTPLPGDSLIVEFQYLPDEERLYLQSVHLLNNKHLELQFNKSLEVASAEEESHYLLEPDNDIMIARVDSSRLNVVHLYLSGNNRLGSLGIPYYITVRNVRDSHGMPLDTSRANRLSIVGEAHNLDNVVVYPNPYRAGSAQNPLMFANLPNGTEIYIFNASGRMLRRLLTEQETGGVVWDLKTAGGAFAGSGVYLYVARYSGQEVKGKFMVIR